MHKASFVFRPEISGLAQLMRSPDDCSERALSNVDGGPLIASSPRLWSLLRPTNTWAIAQVAESSRRCGEIFPLAERVLAA